MELVKFGASNSCLSNKRYLIIYIRILFCNMLFSPYIRLYIGWLDCTLPARAHAPASLQTCLVWHAVTWLFACWYHSGPLKALRRLGVGLECLYSPKWKPLLLTRQFQAQSNRRSHWVAITIEHTDLGCASNPMRVLIRLTVPQSLFTQPKLL